MKCCSSVEVVEEIVDVKGTDAEVDTDVDFDAVIEVDIRPVPPLAMIKSAAAEEGSTDAPAWACVLESNAMVARGARLRAAILLSCVRRMCYRSETYGVRKDRYKENERPAFLAFP